MPLAWAFTRWPIHRGCALIAMFVSLALPPGSALAVERMQPTSGPHGGPVWDLACAPDGDLYALSYGVFRSPDDGNTWSQVQSAPASGLATSFGGPIFAFGSSGIYRSASDGREWTRLPRAPTGVHTLLFVLGRSLGYAGTGRGVFLTKDEGDTWTWTDVPAVPIRALAGGAEGRVYAGGDGDIWISRDHGETWSHFATVPHAVTALAERPGGSLYVGVSTQVGSPQPGGVYLIDTNGDATPMSLQSMDITAFVVRGDEVFASSSGSAQDGSHCCCSGIFRSDDAGSTWTLVASGTASVQALVALSGGRLLAATTPLCNDSGDFASMGVLRSDPSGRTWTPANRRLPHAVVYSLAAGPAGLVAAAAERGIAWTKDRGSTWRELATTPTFEPDGGSVGFEVAVHPDGTLFALVPSRSLHATRDLGETWTEISPPGPLTARRVLVTPAGTLIGHTGVALTRSTDQGSTWDRVADLGEAVPGEPLSLAAGALQRVGASAATGTYLSEDDGSTWRVVAAVAGVVAFAPDARSIYIATGRDVFRLHEAQSWAPESMPALWNTTDLAVTPDGAVYAASAGRIWRWRSGDTAWLPLDGDTCMRDYMGQHGRGFEYRLAIDSDGYLYMGTQCSGVYRSDASTPVSVHDLEALATAAGVWLRWRLPPGVMEELRGVHVQRALGAGGPYDDRHALALEPRAAMEFVDSEVEPGVVYWYRLALRSSAGTVTFTSPIEIAIAARDGMQTGLDTPIEAKDAGLVQIRYRVGPGPANVQLAIYDLRGRRVRGFDEGLRAPGPHARAWDRTDAAGLSVPRGLYLLRLDAGGLEAVRKIVLR